MSTSVVLDARTLDPFMLGQEGRRRPSRDAATAIRLPHPGRCPHQPAHSIFLFDNSGSVCGGNDPIGRRFEEGRIAVERVSKACRCRAELVSVLHFDTPTAAMSWLPVWGGEGERRSAVAWRCRQKPAAVLNSVPA